MPAAANVGHKLDLLRHIVENMVQRPLPGDRITHDLLRAEGLARARRTTQNALVGLKPPGAEAFNQLSEIIFSSDPKMERGAEFVAYEEQLFTLLITNYFDRSADTLDKSDVEHIVENIKDWFIEKSSTYTLFVPCMISRWPSPRFSVGPVSFIFIDEVEYSNFHLSDRTLSVFQFTNLLKSMRDEKANWLAVIEVGECHQARAMAIGDLAVDLAIVYLQLAQPYLGTKTMSRLSTFRGPLTMHTFVASHGYLSGGFQNMEPGSSIGNGYLGKIVSDTASLNSTIGNIINSFVCDKFRLPKLEQAWCDAAYWFHQGFSEPLDSIAVAKFETAIEVLFRAENSKGSQKRLETALDTFYGLKSADYITASRKITARQFAKMLVHDRSRVLHGTLSTLGSRLASRDDLENLAMTLVRSSALELDAYLQTPSPKDEVETFLSWVKEIRTKRIADTAC